MTDLNTEKQKVKEIIDKQEESAESGADREAQLLYGGTDKYGIYQLKDNPELGQFQFSGTESLKRRGIIKDNFDAIKPENYSLVYVGELSELSKDVKSLQTQGDTLEALFEKFNIDHPEDFKGHSLSVSDIVVLHENGENSAHFVDSFGFTGLPDFMRELEGVKEQAGAEQKTYPPLYRQSLAYAAANEEKGAFRESWELNKKCKRAVEEAVSQNFDGMHLDKDAVKPVLEEYGVERLSFILANTLKQEEWDARFSRDNVAWATDFFMSENIDYGAEGNLYLSLSSHPAVLDGFIDMFRREVEMKQSLKGEALKQRDAAVSLKARLAEKKAFVSGQGKDHEAQENAKKNQREM